MVGHIDMPKIEALHKRTLKKNASVYSVSILQYVRLKSLNQFSRVIFGGFVTILSEPRFLNDLASRTNVN